MWFLVQVYEPLVFFSKFEIAFFQILRADRGQPATFPCPSGIRFRLQMGCVGHGPPRPVCWQQTNHMGTVLFRRNKYMNTHGVEPARAATAGPSCGNVRWGESAGGSARRQACGVDGCGGLGFEPFALCFVTRQSSVPRPSLVAALIVVENEKANRR